MEFIRKFDAIQWKNGEVKQIKEQTVDDEYTYLFIDFLPPRKFSTYPKDLEDFAVGYCLGEGLIKDYTDIESINVDGTNVLVSTKLKHDPEEDNEQDGIVQERKGDCQHERIIREDVSRHVAVDKVIGAAAERGYDFSKCYITYSGRMPADMLIKVIRIGVPIIISNAAPAGSGYDVAKTGNITMIGFVRGDRFTIYTAPERVNLEK